MLIGNRHSLTIYIVKFVTDSIQKNDGTNIFILVGNYINKCMVNGRPGFRTEDWLVMKVMSWRKGFGT